MCYYFSIAIVRFLVAKWHPIRLKLWCQPALIHLVWAAGGPRCVNIPFQLLFSASRYFPEESISLSWPCVFHRNNPTVNLTHASRCPICVADSYGLLLNPAWYQRLMKRRIHRATIVWYDNNLSLDVHLIFSWKYTATSDHHWVI